RQVLPAVAELLFPAGSIAGDREARAAPGADGQEHVRARATAQVEHPRPGLDLGRLDPGRDGPVTVELTDHTLRHGHIRLTVAEVESRSDPPVLARTVRCAVGRQCTVGPLHDRSTWFDAHLV